MTLATTFTLGLSAVIVGACVLSVLCFILSLVFAWEPYRVAHPLWLLAGVVLFTIGVTLFVAKLFGGVA